MWTNQGGGQPSWWPPRLRLFFLPRLRSPGIVLAVGPIPSCVPILEVVMSPTCENFIRAVLSQTWRDAFLQLNGLDMWEMLRALAALDRQDLNDLWTNQTAFLGAIPWGRDAMPRMEYARSVVVDRRLPSSAPGDLQATGQVGDAVEFLAHP